MENNTKKAIYLPTDLFTMEDLINKINTIGEQERKIAYLEDIKNRYEATERLINYNYREEETRDIVEYITSEYKREQFEEKTKTAEDRELFEQELNDILWTEDNVTGNGSGSYWFSTYKSALCMASNLDLFVEACEKWGEINPDKLTPEAIDVTIRCYLLGECITAAIDDILNSDYKV